MQPDHRTDTTEKVAALCRGWKTIGLRVVFTNGVFDILHAGHVHYLTQAKALGDKLIVGINSDESVRRLGKSDERPIHPEAARAAVLEALRAVDAVVVFTSDTPLELIQILEPDILVKGGDYNADEENTSSKMYIVGSREVRERGGRVVTIALLPGYSTTAALNKLKK